MSVWVCVGSDSCILWGVIGGTHCKQIFVGISKSPGWSTCSIPFYHFLFSLTHTHTHTGRHINTPTHAFTHIPYLLTRGFSCSRSAHSLSHSLSYSAPLPDSGASRLLYSFQEAGKTSLEFPCPPFQAFRWRK